MNMLGLFTRTAHIAMCICVAAITLGRADPVHSGGLASTGLERVYVGTSARDFTLDDGKGNAITSSHLRERKNVGLVFYRGHW